MDTTSEHSDRIRIRGSGESERIEPEHNGKNVYNGANGNEAGSMHTSGKKFREMSVEERLSFMGGTLSEESVDALRGCRMPIPGENHISFLGLSVGVLPKIIVNGVQRMAPIATEEPSVVAAASCGAKFAERHGGFKVTVTGTDTTGQIQVINLPSHNKPEIETRIKKDSQNLINIANSVSPNIVAAGGGVLNIRPKTIRTSNGVQMIIDFDVDCKNAMGANAVSKMAEAMAQRIEEITGGKVVGRILSNLPLGRLVSCEATFDNDLLAVNKGANGKRIEMTGDEMVDRIIALSDWAGADQFRATTHNKGIMNGITSVALALGQDIRAVEAAAHSYAAYNRKYSPLSHFERDAEGNLYGCLVVPLPIGIVGGTISTNPVVKANLEVTGCKDSSELAALIAAVGLAQNVSALRMLAGEGITNGHMPLHYLRVGNGSSSHNGNGHDPVPLRKD